MNDSQVTTLAIGLCLGIPWLLLVIYLLKRWLCPPPVANQYIVPEPKPVPPPPKRTLSRGRPVIVVVRK